jgi:UDP-glucuronate decarboxylase
VLRRDETTQELAELVLDSADTSSELTYAPLPEDDPKQRRLYVSMVRDHINFELTVDLE